MDKREFPRISFHEPVGYQLREDLPENGSLAADISQGGVRVRMNEFIPLHTVLELKLHMSNPHRIMPVRGQVVWVREVPHSDVFDVGIRFLQSQKIQF